MPHRPDWYADPADPKLVRYWDGSNWTEHTAPRVPDYSPANTKPSITLAGSISLGASLTGIAVLLLALSGGFSCDEPNCSSSTIATLWVLVGVGLAFECLALLVALIGRRAQSTAQDPNLLVGLCISAAVLGVVALWTAFVLGST